MARFFEPRSIAVIGASRERGTVGGELFHNLLEAAWGPVYPVNSAAEVVQSVRAYRSVTEVPPVELAVIAVPGEAAVGAVRECAAKGVRAVVVISAGFGESGAEGIERQRELLAACREAGIRLVGPNCLGVLARADAPLNATFAPAMPCGKGRFRLQSGALGLAMIELATDRSLGISRSRRSETGPTSPQTTCSSTGRVTRRRTWPCSTSNRSATRDASHTSRAASAARSRSWP